jgi:hypothetical protein
VRACLTRRDTHLRPSQPPAVAAVQAPLLEVPLPELGRALASFTLPPGDAKPDLLHWLPLLNRLDELLERAAAHADVALATAPPADGEALPVGDVVAALRASALLLDFSHNRQLYGSAEVRGCARARARPLFAPDKRASRALPVPSRR